MRAKCYETAIAEIEEAAGGKEVVVGGESTTGGVPVPDEDTQAIWEIWNRMSERRAGQNWSEEKVWVNLLGKKPEFSLQTPTCVNESVRDH